MYMYMAPIHPEDDVNQKYIGTNRERILPLKNWDTNYVHMIDVAYMHDFDKHLNDFITSYYDVWR